MHVGHVAVAYYTAELGGRGYIGVADALCRRAKLFSENSHANSHILHVQEVFLCKHKRPDCKDLNRKFWSDMFCTWGNHPNSYQHKSPSWDPAVTVLHSLCLVFPCSTGNQKLKNHMKFPLSNLDLSQFCAKGKLTSSRNGKICESASCTSSYRLIAVIVHHGSTCLTSCISLPECCVYVSDSWTTYRMHSSICNTWIPTCAPRSSSLCIVACVLPSLRQITLGETCCQISFAMPWNVLLRSFRFCLV